MKTSLLLETNGQLTVHWRQSVSLEKEQYVLKISLVKKQ